MFAVSARRLTNSLINKNVISESDFELYNFGFKMGFAILANIFTTLFIGILFRMPVESLLFLAAFIPLRSYTGGYHASNYTRCYLLSTLLVVVLLIAVRFVSSTLSAAVILGVSLVCATAMLVLVPVQDRNRPLEEIEIRVFRKRARITLCLEFTALIILTAASLDTIVSVLCCTFCLTGITTVMGVIKNRLHEKNNISNRRYN